MGKRKEVYSKVEVEELVLNLTLKTTDVVKALLEQVEKNRLDSMEMIQSLITVAKDHKDVITRQNEEIVKIEKAVAPIYQQFEQEQNQLMMKFFDSIDPTKLQC